MQVNGGTLAVNGSLAAASGVTVASGATLTGTGTVTGRVTLASGGRIQPTGGLGILHTGNLSLLAGSTLAASLNGNTLGTQYGQVSVTGTVNGVNYTISYTGGDGNDVVLTDITNVNAAPVVIAGNATLTVNEGQQTSNGGTVADPDGDSVMLTATIAGTPVGTITRNGGTWNWTYTPSDSSSTQTVTITADDQHGGIATCNFALSISNISPTATFANGGPVDQYSPVSVSFADPSDSPGDLAAGLHYSYALDSADYLVGTYAQAVDGPSRTFTFVDSGTYTVHGRVFDQDGSYTDYTTDVTVNSVAPAVAIVGAPWNVLPSTPITLSSAVTYNGNPRTAGISYAWTITLDGSPYLLATDAAVTFTPGDIGEYDISLTVTDRNGQIATAWDYFEVAPFTATVSGAATVTAGQPYTLSLATAGPGAANVTSWSIDWGDGSDLQVVDGSPSTVTHAFNACATDTFIYAGATDGTSTVYAAPVPITVAPDWSSLSVTGGSTVAAGVTYTLSLTATYPEGSTGVVSQWSIDWGDGSFNAPDIQIVSGDTTSVTHTFAPGVGHAEIIVTATDTTGNYDAPAVLVAISGVSAPTAPANVVISPWSSTELDLSWTGSANALSFNISRSADGGQTWTLLDTVDGDQTSYADAGLTAETAYAYQVTASNDGGTSAADPAGPGASATTSSGLPTFSKDSIVAPVAGSTSGAVTLSWSDVDGNVTGFELEQMLEGVNDQGITENFYWRCAPGAGDGSQTISGLKAGRTYQFRIRSDFADGTVSEYVSISPAVTIPDAPVGDPGDAGATLPAPTNVTISGPDEYGYCVVEWSEAGGDGGFEITTSGNDPYQLALIGYSPTSYHLTRDPNTGRYSTTVCLRGGGVQGKLTVRAWTLDREFSPGTSKFFTSFGAALPTPSLSAVPVANNPGRVTLSWTGVQHAPPGTYMYVQVYLADSGEAGPGKVHYVVSVLAVDGQDGQVEVAAGAAGQRFFAVVIGQVNVQSCLQTSPYSNFVRGDGLPDVPVVPAVPAAPTNLRGSWAEDGSNKVNLAWSNTPGNETGYVIESATDENCLENKLVDITPPDVTTYVDTTVESGMVYYYRVYARGESTHDNPLGVGSPSNILIPDYTVRKVRAVGAMPWPFLKLCGPGAYESALQLQDNIDVVTAVWGFLGNIQVGVNILQNTEDAAKLAEIIVKKAVDEQGKQLLTTLADKAEMRRQIIKFGTDYAGLSAPLGYSIWVHVKGEVYRHGEWTDREAWINVSDTPYMKVTGKDIADAVGLAIPKFGAELKEWDGHSEW